LATIFMKTLLTSILLLWIESIQGQSCMDSIKNYPSHIDTVVRKVVIFADEMPSILMDNTLFDLINKEIELNDLQCCPIYVWFKFVAEIDSSLTNILVCPQFAACDSTDLIERETKILVNRFTKLFSGIKTSPGKLNGRPIAVAHHSRIHYECMGIK
jgi:hypothetical protein